MRLLAESRLAEVEQIKRQFLEGREGMEPMDREELLALVRQGAVTVLDVRPVEEFKAGHVAGALSIPFQELKLRLSDLPRDQEIVAYCRGPYCVLSIEAVEMLRAEGFQAIRIEEGIQDFRVMGFPIAVGEQA
jgi:rhodanese-related sulfurtransferase